MWRTDGRGDGRAAGAQAFRRERACEPEQGGGGGSPINDGGETHDIMLQAVTNNWFSSIFQVSKWFRVDATFMGGDWIRSRLLAGWFPSSQHRAALETDAVASSGPQQPNFQRKLQ